jgi:NAD(P)-dependent dehydrogenase (short-subunit alcohol dehydrogenase family)
MRLKNRTALITGAGSGIGRATAQLFAREGAAVVVADIDGEAGKSTAASLIANRGRAFFERTDVSSATYCKRLVERTIREFGRIDILFNNAGIIRRATVLELTEEDWDRVIDVNVKSMYLMCREVIPHMLKAGGGSIINMASGWGLAGGPKAAAYCASKGAVVLMTKALAVDHGRQNIRVNCLCPGDTDTGMLRNEAQQLGVPETEFLADSGRRPLGRMGTPEDIARAALYLASEASSFVTGAALVVDGGGLAGSP